MRLTFSKNFWLILTFIIAFSFLLASYIPNIYEASVVDLMPKDRIMLWGEHIYTYDYNVYLSKMRQGAEGRWSVVDKYDNNPNQKGVLLQMIYLLSGKVGAIFHLTPPLTFHLLRTILSFLWVLTIIYLNVFFLKTPKRYAIGILLSLLAASFPVFYRYLESWWIGYHMSWWTEMDVLKRISYIPHYTLNYIIIGVLTILLNLFSRSINNKQSPNSNSNFQSPISKIKKLSDWKLVIGSIGFGNWTFDIICVILFFSFFIHPSAGILFLFSWIIYQTIITYMIRPSHIGYFIKLFINTIILFAVAIIPLIYFKSVTSTYPWKSLVDFDKYNRYPVDVKEYILALGPIFFTGVSGIIVVLIKKEQKLFPLVSWILGAFIAIFVFKKFPYASELRFVQTANHVPLAILSVYFITQLLLILEKRRYLFRAFQRADEFGGKFFNARNTVPSFLKIILISIFVLPIIILGLVQSYFSIRSQTDFIHQRAVAGQPLVPYPPQVMYPLKDFWSGLMWLEKNTSRQNIVLSQITAGNYIPAYSGNFVYLGHNPETPHYDERVNKVNQFFSGTISDKDALKFLQDENITHVFYGPQEKEKSVEDIKKYLFLKSVFDSGYITIYKVDSRR